MTPAAALVAPPAWLGRPGAAGQPNEVDLRRIARALTRRARYLYVEPQVLPCDDGYRIQSPCCSRKVDADGGVIDIAWLAFDGRSGLWTLYRKDHGRAEWQLHAHSARLLELLGCLVVDTAQQFWP